jgi:hypothetical protein
MGLIYLRNKKINTLPVKGDRDHIIILNILWSAAIIWNSDVFCLILRMYGLKHASCPS